MKWLFKIFALLRFLLFYLKELLLSNAAVAYDVVTPGFRMQPGVIALPIKQRSNFSLLLLTNLITMTPGTLSLDVSEDRSMLFIHALYLKDPAALRRSMQEKFARYLEEIFA